MQLFSLSFVYLFLPAMLLVMAVTPPRLRAAMLLAASCLSYYWLEGANLLLLLAVVLFDWVMAWLLEHCDLFPRLRMAVLVCSIAKSAAILLLYGFWAQLSGQRAPVGLGVVCLTSLGYVIDCYNGFALWERSPVSILLMNLFFPKLYAGPIITYGRAMIELRGLKLTLERLGQGGAAFVRGLAKKVIVGDTILRLYLAMKAVPLYDTSVLTIWMMVLTLALSVYFELSGLCDMAKGIGLMFGFELPDNFLHPYRSLSINDFFSRFNQTVNRFIRRYVYVNLGGSRGSMLSGTFNILLATILMGLWFGIRINMVVWGVYFTLFILYERYAARKKLELVPPLFRWLYCSAVVLVSFVFMAGDTLMESLRYLQVMFGLSEAEAFNRDLLYLLNSNWLVLTIALLWAGGLPHLAASFIKRWLPRPWTILAAFGSVALLVVTTAYML